MKSDGEIKRDVEAELNWDPDIDTTDVAVSVKDGVVTLVGFVRSYAHKIGAEAAAKRVASVSGVANDLEVRLPSLDQRPDPDIARDAVAAIKSRLPASWENIKIVVQNGWVTLEGDVEWNYQRNAAEEAVRPVKGVKGVVNSIMVRPNARPEELKRKIEEALKRSAQIDAQGIEVEAHGGEVILKGTVRSWLARQEAEKTAWAAPGVMKVEDRITVAL